MTLDPKIQAQLIFSKIKGKPLTILALFSIFGGVLTYANIEEWTDYTRPTVRRALKLLVSLRYAEPITQSRFRLTAIGEQVFAFGKDEKFFQLGSSSSINNIDTNIKDSTTTICKTFSAPPEIVGYLKDKGVWDSQIDEIAYQGNNDLELLKSYFDTLDVALAVHRINSGKPPDEPELTRDQKWGMCGGWVCEKNPCECDEENIE